MKFKKLVKKAEILFSPSKRDEEVKKKSLKKLIKKLKNCEKKTREKLENTTDEEARESLEKKILVARAQRKKGLQLLKKGEE
jgi:hypothetical protein